jgi:hypothetical protein
MIVLRIHEVWKLIWGKFASLSNLEKWKLTTRLYYVIALDISACGISVIFD